MHLKLYFIDDRYVEYLRKYDRKVLFNKFGNRPYIGIILEINSKLYFSPLSSPKLKHKTMKTKIDFIKINEGELGIINLNNSIPIKLEYANLINIKLLKNSNDILDRKYGLLCENQIKWCNNNEYKIKEKFRKLYNHFITDKLPDNVKNRCCDFKLLEDKMELYK